MSWKKNKKLTPVALLVVLLAYGGIAYYFIRDFGSDKIVVPETKITGSFSIPEASKRKEIELLPGSRDPFLGTTNSNKKKSSSSSTQKAEVVWPQILYKGEVKGEKSSTYIIQINGVDLILNKGEEIGEIKLLRGTSQKVILRYQGQSKEFEL